MKLAIFDLDNTLLDGDSDYAWGQFLVDKGIVDPHEYLAENERFYLEYQRKTLDIHEYQRFVLTPLMSMTESTREALHQEYMSSVISRMRLEKADACIQQHQQQGDQLLIITATNRLIAGPIGPWLGIKQILATEPEIINGQLTGNIAGTPCFQEGKIARLTEWLDCHSVVPEQMTFYSDSINDLPLLEYVNTPIAVDPDDRLHAHAQQQGWDIVSFR